MIDTKKEVFMRALVLVILSVFISHSFAVESKNPKAIAVNDSCIEESKVANCGEQKVGTGLLKCIHGYKKEHKDFKISDVCHNAMKDLKEERKERKENKDKKEEVKK